MKLNKNIIVFIISYLFILLFLYAAANKLLDYEKFKAQIGQSTMLTGYAAILAWAVPVVEIVIAVLLMIQRTLKVGLYAAFMLMVIFSTYIGIMLTMSEHIPCSCGGILQKLSWKNHFIFNIGFVGLGIIGIWLEGQKEKGS